MLAVHPVLRGNTHKATETVSSSKHHAETAHPGLSLRLSALAHAYVYARALCVHTCVQGTAQAHMHVQAICMCMHPGLSPNPGSGHGGDGLVTLVTGQDLAKLGQPQFKSKKRKKKIKPQSTKRRWSSMAGGGSSVPGSTHSSPQPSLPAPNPGEGCWSQDPGPRTQRADSP